MSQDLVSDALNQIMNAKKAGKKELEVSRVSKLLINVLKMMKDEKHINFIQDENGLKIQILELSECRAIKPRFNVQVSDIDKYLRRFLPSRNFGKVLISTSSGLMDQNEAYEKKIGGSLIAYFY